MNHDEVLRLARQWDEAVLLLQSEAQTSGGTTPERLPFDRAARLLELLPEAGVYAFAEDARSLVALVPDQRLFVVTLADGKDSITTRPLQGEKIIVGIEWGEPKPAGDLYQDVKTRWTFRYVDQAQPEEEWQRITGRIRIHRNGGETLDPREKLAREIAYRAGWSAFGPPPTGSHLA